jgi:hypothetical protein
MIWYTLAEIRVQRERTKLIPKGLFPCRASSISAIMFSTLSLAFRIRLNCRYRSLNPRCSSSSEGCTPEGFFSGSKARQAYCGRKRSIRFVSPESSQCNSLAKTPFKRAYGRKEHSTRAHGSWLTEKRLWMGFKQVSPVYGRAPCPVRRVPALCVNAPA